MSSLLLHWRLQLVFLFHFPLCHSFSISWPIFPFLPVTSFPYKPWMVFSFLGSKSRLIFFYPHSPAQVPLPHSSHFSSWLPFPRVSPAWLLILVHRVPFPLCLYHFVLSNISLYDISVIVNEALVTFYCGLTLLSVLYLLYLTSFSQNPHLVGTVAQRMADWGAWTQPVHSGTHTTNLILTFSLSGLIAFSSAYP